MAINFIHDSKTPLGLLSITIMDKKLASIKFANPKSEAPIVETKIVATEEVIRQLQTYFQNPQHKFNLKILLTGTPLQNRIWQACQKIPSGTTKTYGDLAKEVATSPRVVGNAMRRNPIPIIIPCHRVIAKNGIGGYCGKQSGKMLNIKKWLSNWEKEGKQFG